MRSKLSSVALSFMLVMMSVAAGAHTMWIEIKGNGKIGETQDVRVFFGDYSWGNPTKTAKWYSDIAEYALVLTAPDGTTTELSDRAKDSAYYESSFVPKEPGVYKVSFSHPVKDVYKDKKLTYAAAAYVLVGKAKTKAVTLSEGKFSLVWKDAAQKKQVVYMEDGQPKANVSLSLVKEGEKDKTYSVSTDSKGQLVFPKELKGNYLLELTDSEKVNKTEFNGKEYEFDYKEFTYRVSL
ncbi:MAG: hypothetical protein EOP54_07410 [Sphingobacteriales bacterium]|nr:MAG: hypothetical protein EOP54_07410 [Sphingobacteriales bacterium]